MWWQFFTLSILSVMTTITAWWHIFELKINYSDVTLIRDLRVGTDSSGQKGNWLNDLPTCLDDHLLSQRARTYAVNGTLFSDEYYLTLIYCLFRRYITSYINEQCNKNYDMHCSRNRDKSSKSVHVETERSLITFVN